MGIGVFSLSEMHFWERLAAMHMYCLIIANSRGVWIYYFKEVIFIDHIPIILIIKSQILSESHRWTIKEQLASLVNFIRQIEVGCQKVLVVKYFFWFMIVTKSIFMLPRY